MSIRNVETFECPKCGHTIEAEVWSSLNVDLNPEMEDVLFAGNLNRITCSNCEFTDLLDTPFLFNNTESIYMIYFLTEGLPPDPDEMPDYIKATPRYQEIQAKIRLRVVRSLPDLLEKIQVFDADLDDRALECMKALMERERSLPASLSGAYAFRGIQPDGRIALFDRVTNQMIYEPRATYDWVKESMKLFYLPSTNPFYFVVDIEFGQMLLPFLDQTQNQAPKKSFFQSIFKRN